MTSTQRPTGPYHTGAFSRIPRMDLRSLEALASAGEIAGLGPIVDIAAMAYEGGPIGPATTEALRQLPIVTMAVASDGEAVDADVRRLVDLIAPPQWSDRVRDTVMRNPEASVTVSCLLRLTETLPILDAIHLESLAYATLQSGTEFAAWVAEHPRRESATDEGESLLLDDQGGCTALVLNRPRNSNALNAAMRADLFMALTALSFVDSPVILRGRGPHFCAGGDLSEFDGVATPAVAHLTRMRQNLPAAAARISERLTAEVHGACIGAGMELSSFAHRVVAAPDSTWRLPEVTMGLLPGCGGTVSIPRRIGRQRTLLLALTNVAIDAPTALGWGLIDEVTE